MNDTLIPLPYFGNDDLINGQHYSVPFPGGLARSGDSVKVALVACDEAYYSYLYSFSNQDNSSPFTAAPSNPVSNIVGENAIGYFAAFTSDTLAVKIPE